MQRRELNDAERRDWLRLARTENIGPVSFRQLVARYGTATDALDALPDLAKRGGKRSFRIPSVSAVEDEIAAIEKSGGKLIARGEAAYPEALAAIEDAPPLDESELPAARTAILEYLGPSPTSIDDLIRQSALSPAVALTVLLEFELAGRIERQAGHKVALIEGDSGADAAWPEAQVISA